MRVQCSLDRYNRTVDCGTFIGDLKAEKCAEHAYCEKSCNMSKVNYTSWNFIGETNPFILSIVLFAFIQIPFCMDIRNLVIIIFIIGKLYDNGE